MSPKWLLTILAASAAVVSAGPVAQQPIDSNDTGWQKYVRAPPTRTVLPARILSQYTKGNVSNPNGLLSGGESPAILSRLSADQDLPTIVIDFGQNVAGLLSITFGVSYNTSQGLPGVKLAFSETLQFLANRSDFTRSDNASGVSAPTCIELEETVETHKSPGPEAHQRHRPGELQTATFR